MTCCCNVHAAEQPVQNAFACKVTVGLTCTAPLRHSSGQVTGRGRQRSEQVLLDWRTRWPVVDRERVKGKASSVDEQ